MTSFRQIEANRRNAHRSTGPNTEEGKRRSRQDAVRHGLCAETVVEILEDIEDYRGFEAAVIADYDARTAVEREMVLRLASLLWRLRRATAIETDLLRIQAEIQRERRSAGRPDRSPTSPAGLRSPAYPVLAATADADGNDPPWPTDRDPLLPRPYLDAPAHRLPTPADPEFPAARQPRQRDLRAARAVRSGPCTSGSENDFPAEVGARPVSHQGRSRWKLLVLNASSY